MHTTSECLRCGAVDCVDDECTGYGEREVERADACSDDGLSCAADAELAMAWGYGK